MRRFVPDRSGFLRAAIRDGRLISAAKRRAKAAARLSGNSPSVIICDDPDQPSTPEDRARLKTWIVEELAKE